MFRHSIKIAFALCTFAGNALAVELHRATILVSPQAEPVVRTATEMLRSDIQTVTGVQRPILTSSKASGDKVVIGTIGQHPVIDALISKGKIDVTDIQGCTERFRIVHPDSHTMLIVGSDARGTAYGAMHVSREIGVSPWAWWADVPVVRRPVLSYSRSFTSKSPSVRYRGIFINDEDWGLKTWSSLNYEKDLGDIGPRTYERVCELLLRLGGNMLAPAMHTCTGAFFSHPESQVVANRYGIMITTSHCEPLLINNASKSEWDTAIDGEWNYATNSERIRRKFNERIQQTSQYDNIYTTGMRGLHDEGMRGDYPMAKRVEILEQVIADQRDILTKHKRKDAMEIPQIFIPYKEALDIYDAGLKVPDDITLVWPDDNYGYMKRISNAEEQARKGHSGVYYHVSYLGSPHDYLWICTTPPALMYEELYKSYKSGADRYWLLNVGDIKPAELAIQTFFDMALDIESYDYQSINQHQSHFLDSLFGQDLQGRFQSLLDQYYQLAWDHKPEFMGYERAWDIRREREDLHDSHYSFATGTAQARLASYRELAIEAKALEKAVDFGSRDAFYEMIGFQCLASEQMNRKFLMAQLNHETGSDEAKKASLQAIDSINALMHRYNTLQNGKWDHMMTLPPGLVARYQNTPPYGKGDYRDPWLAPAPSAPRQIIPLQLTEDNSRHFRIIPGMGIDWKVLQMGEVGDPAENPLSLQSSHIELPVGYVDADTLKLRISVVPVWPATQKSGTRIGVSVDGSTPQVIENKFREYSEEWKDQVLINSKSFVLQFPINKELPQHRLRLIIGDPGQMIQRIEVIDQE